MKIEKFICSYFFRFLSNLETSHFSFQGWVNEKPHLLSNEAQSMKKNCFRGIALFLASTRNFNLVFVILIKILVFFLRFFYILESYGIDSLSKNAIDFVMSII